MAKIYYGLDAKDGRVIFTTVTGQMADGSLVYTEIEQTEGNAVKFNKDGSPKLILDNQYTRRLRYGCQTFHRL